MIPFAEALRIVLEKAKALECEEVPLGSAFGRYLGQDLVADADMPRFDSSSVDGFGVKAEDLEGASEQAPVCLPVAGTVAAGRTWGAALPPGTALKIMTGATVPDGVGACVMREHAVESVGRVTFSGPVRPGENIRPRGGEYHAGATLLPKGTRVTPPVASVLASLGRSVVNVHRLPSVCLLVTGTEIVAPGEALASGQIYDSNGLGLEAATRALGVSEIRTTSCADDPRAIGSAIGAALNGADVVVTSGGVSVGDFDFVPAAFEALGGQRRFWKVAVKPGKPNYFGIWEGSAGHSSFFFGLPGNPVSALLSFERLVKPCLLRLMGSHGVTPRTLHARLASRIDKSPGRLEWVRGVLDFSGGEPVVAPIAHRESHMLLGLALSDCLIAFPAEEGHLEAGSPVEVHLLEWTI
jgi:molybdopterin molybdotransferase